VYEEDVSGSVTSFTWPVQTNKNLTFSSTFYLNFFRKGPGQNYPLSTSQPFNITRKETNDDSSSALTSSITTGSISAPAPSTTSTPTLVSDPDSNALASGGLSNGAKAGIGVGVAAGALLVIANVVAWIFVRRQRRKLVPAGPESAAVQTGFYGLEKQHHEIDGRAAVQAQELGGRERVIELP